MRQSHKINNLFTLITIALISIVMFIYVNYIPQESNLPKLPNSGLECQKEVICFDKVFDSKLLQDGIKLLKNGDYSLIGDITPALHMPSLIESKFDLIQSDELFKKAINITQNLDSEQYLTINYQLIENDKLDPNKKSNSAHCKLYAGYLLSSFTLQGKQIFRMQIDFNSYDLEELEKRIDCTIKAFLHHEK